MLWAVAMLIHTFLASLRSVQSRRIGLSKQDLSAYALFVSFFGVGTLGIIYSMVSEGNPDHGAALNKIGYLIIGGLLFASVNYLVFRLFRAAPASMVVILSLLNTVSVVVLSVVLLGETLTNKQWVGAVLLVSSAIFAKWLSVKKKKNTTNIKVKIVAVAILVALMYGLAMVNEKYLIDRIGVETYLLYGWGFQAVASIIIAFKLGLTNQIKTTTKNHINVWAVGLLLPISGAFFIISLTESDSVSLSSIGSSLKLVFALVLAYVILHERRDTFLKAISVVFAVIGFTLLV